VRRVFRDALEPDACQALRRERVRKPAADNPWAAFRKSRRSDPVLKALRRAAGFADRCMYCGDSQGADVEHYWPKEDYPDSTFRWTNLLLVCTVCNRKKLNRGPECDTGQILDPSRVDPWARVIFVPETGRIEPRFLSSTARDVDAECTLRILNHLNDEVLLERRRSEYSDVTVAVESLLAGEHAQWSLHVIGRRSMGISDWCLIHEGLQYEPFRTLRLSGGLFRRAMAALAGAPDC
jgi:uncharacterized protein (TIGR02646 family)